MKTMEKEIFLKKLGKRVIKVREQKGWSQSELARQCEKDRQSIERLENGKINPSAFYLHELATALGVKISDLTDI